MISVLLKSISAGGEFPCQVRFLLSVVWLICVWLMHGAEWQRCTAQDKQVRPIEQVMQVSSRNMSKLIGTVCDEHGNPIEGAIIDIQTAKPRFGISLTCPSCYLDCARSTTTRRNGTFELDGLSADLLFCVLVLAEGRRSEIVDWINPDSQSLEVRLRPIPSDMKPGQMLTGHIFDENGEPIAGAIVSPTGARTVERHWWGQVSGVDQASVSDAKGKFVIVSSEPIIGLYLRVSAPGFAEIPSHYSLLIDNAASIRMMRGSIVSGRLMANEKPAAYRSIGIVQRDRSHRTFVGPKLLQTDGYGRFQFTDLLPNQTYVMYTPSDRQSNNPPVFIADHFVAQSKTIATGNSNSVTEIGDMQLKQAVSLRGKISTSTGESIPSGTKIGLEGMLGWSFRETEARDDGLFVFHGLAPEAYRIVVRAQGFNPSFSNVNVQESGQNRVQLILNRP